MAKIIKINKAEKMSDYWVRIEYDGGVAELPIIEHKIGRVLLGVFHLFHANTKKTFLAASGYRKDGNEPLIKLGYLLFNGGDDGVLFETEEDGYKWMPDGYEEWIKGRDKYCADNYDDGLGKTTKEIYNKIIELGD